jgi:tetratricopeptide (TPR) repeat protein
MELARFDEAVLLLDQVLAQAQDSDWYNGALLRKGDCLFALGSNNGVRYKEALYAYRELVLQENLPPTQTLQLHYKIARCLEKLKRVDEAIDEYYSEVMIRYQNERTHGVWHDETSASFYVRAAFNVSELYEQKGLSDQSIRVLQRVIQAGVPGEDEARQRIERLKRKKL